MGYVAVTGGTEAINSAEELVRYFRVKGDSTPLEVKTNQGSAAAGS